MIFSNISFQMSVSFFNIALSIPMFHMRTERC